MSDTQAPTPAPAQAAAPQQAPPENPPVSQPTNPPANPAPAVKSEPMDTQPPPQPAAQQPAAQQSAGQSGAAVAKEQDLINKKEAERLLGELAKAVQKTQKYRKETKEEKNVQKLTAIAGAIVTKKLEFQMVVDKEGKKLSLECTNLKSEVKQIQEALKAVKQIGRRSMRGRGRGRRGRSKHSSDLD